MTNGLEKLKALTESLLVKDRQIRFAEEIYKAVFDSIPLPGIVLQLPDFTLVDANKKAVDTFGYPYEEIMTMFAYSKSMNPEYTKKRLLNHESDAEGAFIHKDGHIIKTSSSLRYFTLNDVEYCLVIINVIEILEGLSNGK